MPRLDKQMVPLLAVCCASVPHSRIQHFLRAPPSPSRTPALTPFPSASIYANGKLMFPLYSPQLNRLLFLEQSKNAWISIQQPWCLAPWWGVIGLLNCSCSVQSARLRHPEEPAASWKPPWRGAPPVGNPRETQDMVEDLCLSTDLETSTPDKAVEDGWVDIIQLHKDAGYEA